MKLVYPTGATPLDPNETAGLIPNYITLQSELNELEAKNIENAIRWAKKSKIKDILNISFVMELHKQMFGEVWRWAGKQRSSEKSIGVMKDQISIKLNQLLKNTDHWIQYNIYSWDEIAARFHHGLVAIHPFANGNGRHSRLMTNILLQRYEQKPFTWGQKTSSEPIEVEGAVRNEYVSSLKAADVGKIDLLLKFVRS